MHDASRGGSAQERPRHVDVHDEAELIHGVVNSWTPPRDASTGDESSDGVAGLGLSRRESIRDTGFAGDIAGNVVDLSLRLLCSLLKRQPDILRRCGREVCQDDIGTLLQQGLGQ